MAEGEDPQSAELASLKEFGNVALTTEAARRVWTPWWVEALHDQVSDVRYAIRALAKNPVFSLTVVGVLTLGIGLNAAVFTMLKSMALSPIAGVAGSAQLTSSSRETSTGASPLSYPDYQYLRDHDRAFSGSMGPSSPGRPRQRPRRAPSVGRARHRQLLPGPRRSRRSAAARCCRQTKSRPDGHPVVVLSDGLWRRDFAADPNIVGKTVEINNCPLTVVGIAAPSFHGTTVVYDVELFVPMMMAPQLGFTFGSQQTTASGILADRRASLFIPQGYLRPGVDPRRPPRRSTRSAPLSQDRPLADATERLETVPFWRTPGGAPSILCRRCPCSARWDCWC